MNICEFQNYLFFTYFTAYVPRDCFYCELKLRQHSLNYLLAALIAFEALKKQFGPFRGRFLPVRHYLRDFRNKWFNQPIPGKCSLSMTWFSDVFRGYRKKTLT